MAAPLTPTGVKVQGKYKMAFTPTGSLTAPSTALLIGATALDISNIAYADSGRPAKEQSTGTAPRRLGSVDMWQQFGSVTHSFSAELRYVIDPQAAAATDGKKAWEKFPPGTVGVITVRPGLSIDTDFAIGQFAFAGNVELGARIIDGDPTDEFAEFAVVQQIIVRSPGWGDLVALVA